MTSINYCCATYNVSTVSDLCLRLDEYSAQVSSPEAMEILNKNLENRSTAEHNKLRQIALEIYTRLSPSMFPSQLGVFGQLPDIICLQELYRRDPEKQPLLACIQQQGYQIYGQRDTAIAVASQRFSLIKETQLESAFVVDLKDLFHPIVVRVVSDHLAGFNAQTQKKATAILKESERAAESQTILQSKEVKKWGPLQGDKDLIQNLAMLAEDTSHPPQLTIYGLDANATAGYVHKNSRLHTKRLAPLIENGFVSDENDGNPTIIDLNDKVFRRYDYLFAKALKGSLKIESRTPSYPLNTPEITFSDHQPTISMIQLTI